MPASCDPADPKSCVQPLLEGERAPFTGQLLTGRRAALLAVRADQADERTQLKLAEAEALWQVKLDLAATKHQIQLDGARTEARLWQQNAEQQIPPWYAHPAFVATVAGVVGLVVGVLSTRLAIEALRAS